jgi:multiple antibiotic resistance protein
MGIQQLNANHPTINKEEQIEGMERDDVSVFPLAIPLLAGPGAISTIVIFASNDPTWGRLAMLTLGIIGAMLTSWIALKYAPILFKVLGQTGLNLMTRLVGIVLTAVAVQFILDGLTAALAKGKLP